MIPFSSVRPLLFSSHRALLLALGLLIHAAGAWAQDVAAPPEEMSEPSANIAASTDEIVVTGKSAGSTPDLSRTGVPVVEQPRSIAVVGQDLLSQRQVLEISEALRTVSGVGQVGNYAQFRPSYIVRGFSLTRVFEDGFNVGTTGRTAELAGTEQLEVLKGPAGALYGNINPGGILNLSSKKPQSDRAGSVHGTITDDGLYRTQADLTGPLDTAGRWLWRGVAVYEEGDSFRDFVDRESFFVNPSLSWLPGPDTRVDVLARWHHARGTHDQGTPISRSLTDLPPERLLNEPSDPAAYDVGALRALLTHRLDERWNLSGGLNASITDYDNFFQTFRLPANSDMAVRGTELARLPINEQARDEDYIAQVGLTGDLRLLGLRHRVATGIELNRNGRRATSFADPMFPNRIDFLDPQYGQRVPRDIVTRYTNDRTQAAALYLNDQISLTETLGLALGARADYVEVEREVEMTGVRTRSYDAEVSPFAGLLWQALEPLALFANYSEGYTTQVGTQLEGGAMPEPNLGTQVEAGARWQSTDREWSASLAAFRIRQENILVSVPGQNFSIQSGEQQSTGLEVDVQARPLPPWTLTAAYTYLDATVENDTRLPEGASLVNAPNNTLSLWSRYEPAFAALPGLNLGLGVFYLGSRAANLIAPTDTNPGGNTVVLDSYTRLDAALGWARGPMSLDLYLENLTDENYLHPRGPVMHPQPPRSARMSLAYRF